MPAWLLSLGYQLSSTESRQLFSHLKVLSSPPACQEHLVKSTGCLHLVHLCSRLNSSENISISAPHSGHLQRKDERFLKFSNPGQCVGVVIVIPPLIQ